VLNENEFSTALLCNSLRHKLRLTISLTLQMREIANNFVVFQVRFGEELIEVKE
jgi:hypothetical protein